MGDYIEFALLDRKVWLFCFLLDYFAFLEGHEGKMQKC
ncbi:hypothetical protein DOT_3552 [Desulfosporosinus sp. OT]|nr:hypothetical protein DOT_3552 [Desulfosporosinus sp. OT]